VSTTRPDLELPQGNLSRLAVGVNGASAVLLTTGVASDIPKLATHGQRTIAALFLGAALVSWAGWMWGRIHSTRLAAWSLAAMALTGGALVSFATVAMVFPGVATLSATTVQRRSIAAAIGALGALTMFLSVWASGSSVFIAVGGLAAVLGGAIVGITRRQAVERTEQTAHMEVAMARADVERERAAMLAERNHMARELHDVLAHTLAALSVQLEAFSTVVDAEPSTSPAVVEQLERTKRLVHEGLDEARGAVRALRDDAGPLSTQLERLSLQHHAVFRRSGLERILPPPVTLSLFRVVQEALTNALKHSPGSTATVALEVAPDRVTVVVENPMLATGAPSALAGSGGGYGLRGIAERVELLGGSVETGPVAGNWCVRAVVALDDASTQPGDRAAPDEVDA
jgi:signal transduction histidine kinase